MQQSDQTNTQMGKRPARFFKHQFVSPEAQPQKEKLEEPDVAALPTTVLPAVTPHPMNWRSLISVQ
jgi:hypothetical protein